MKKFKLQLLWKMLFSKHIVLMFSKNDAGSFNLMHNVTIWQGTKLATGALNKFIEERLKELQSIRQLEYLSLYKEAPPALDIEIQGCQNYLAEQQKAKQRPMNNVPDTTKPALPMGKEMPLKNKIIEKNKKKEFNTVATNHKE